MRPPDSDSDEGVVLPQTARRSKTRLQARVLRGLLVATMRHQAVQPAMTHTELAILPSAAAWKRIKEGVSCAAGRGLSNDWAALGDMLHCMPC
jgi:hypothetical protein